MTSAISATGLQVRFGNNVALSGVDLAVPAGTSLAVIGPNGSGKSTLLGVLAGTIAATAGSAKISGSAPALVLQSTEVDESLPLSVRDTVSLARYASLGLFRRFGSIDREAVDNALVRMGIGDLGGRQLHDLSGGQRQRVLIAQGLAQHTDVLLLDEPMTGLDANSHATVLDVLDEEVASGRTVVMTTHNLDDAHRCHQVLVLDTAPVTIGAPKIALTEHHLRRVFGGHSIRIGDELFLDDPHHVH